MQLRPYQQEAVAAAYQHLRTREDNPCIVIPTAGGKTPILATICRDVAERWGGRVLVLAHVKELLEQAVEKLSIMAPDLPVGVYSAGLNSRDTIHPIIVAGIQSVFKRAEELGPFDIILIDEAHLMPPDGEGMYQTFMADARVQNPNVRLIGLTATPYRTTSGTICGDDHLLNHVCYEAGIRELIAQGYLCPLRSKAGQQVADTSGLHVRGGEFIPLEAEELMDREELVRSACAEVVAKSADRKAVLLFAQSVQHARHIQDVVAGLVGECGLVTGDTTPALRAETLDRFKDGDLKYLVNVNVLTTGFDAPNIDTIALLRATMSPGLYYQMVGRGFRLAPDKVDCLVLDYGGNILRHGPVDMMDTRPQGKAGGGEAPAKQCQKCNEVVNAGYATCPACGFEFPPPDRQPHKVTASDASILSGEVEEVEHEIRSVQYAVHAKIGAGPDHPRTMRVEYEIAWKTFASEWVCPEHQGYARDKFRKWWAERTDQPAPRTARDAVAVGLAGGLAEPITVTIRTVSGEKFGSIVGHTLGEKPPAPDPDAWQGDDPPGYPQGYGEPLSIDDEDIPF